MNLDIKVLLTNTILKGQNANIWKGDYVAGRMDMLLLRLIRNGRQNGRLTVEGIEKAFQDRHIEIEKMKCWVPSGQDGIRLYIKMKNISFGLVFENEKVHLQAELRYFMLDKKEYQVMATDSQALVDGMVSVDEEIGEMCDGWSGLVAECIKKSRMIDMQSAAVEAYMNQCLRETGYTFGKYVTSESIVVELTAQGEKELTTSLTIGDNVKEKIDALVKEMDDYFSGQTKK